MKKQEATIDKGRGAAKMKTGLCFTFMFLLSSVLLSLCQSAFSNSGTFRETASEVVELISENFRIRKEIDALEDFNEKLSQEFRQKAMVFDGLRHNFVLTPIPFSDSIFAQDNLEWYSRIQLQKQEDKGAAFQEENNGMMAPKPARPEGTTGSIQSESARAARLTILDHEAKRKANANPRRTRVETGAARTSHSVRGTILKHQVAIHDLYHQELKLRPDLNGNLTVRFRINSKGNLIRPEIVRSSVNINGFDQRILKKMKSWNDFGEAISLEDGRTYSVEYVFNPPSPQN